MSEEAETYSYFEVDPANILTGQENQISADTPEEYAKALSNATKTGIAILDNWRALDSFYKDLTRKAGAGASLPPPPVPKNNPASAPPSETLPPLPAVEDTPKLQGAADFEQKIMVDIRPSEGTVSPERMPDYYWALPSPTGQPSAEELVTRVSPAPANPIDADALVRRTQRNEPAPRERHPTHAAPAAQKPAAAADPIDLFSGAFTVGLVDLIVPTAHIPIAMSRSYRSGRPYFGPFGFGWDHSYNVYLRELNDGGFALWNGQLREQHFKVAGTGWDPEPGLAARLERIGVLNENYAVRFPGGLIWQFERPLGWSGTERIPLATIADRHGNTVSLTYGLMNHLESVLDESGRGLRFHYGSCELVESVTDHTELRVVHYLHENEVEHLVTVVLPATAQYPKGISTTYEYDSDAVHPAMKHNILRIYDSNDRLMVENEFGKPDAGFEFNTIVRQRMGEFEYQFEYQQIQYVWPDPQYVDVLASRTLVQAPDGSLHTYTFNYRGDLLDHRFRLIMDGSLRVVSQQWQHDEQGNVTKSVAPDGMRKIFTFDTDNSDPCARRNLTKIEIAAPFSGLVLSRVIFQAQYDLHFQLPLWTKEESGAEESEAKTEFRYDFDVLPVGSSGRLSQILMPVVTGANGVPQQSVAVFERNNRGQVTATISPEGVRKEFKYFAGQILDRFLDGFLASVTADPTDANLISRFQYDSAGFPSSIEEPGSRTTLFTFNALGQCEKQSAPEVDGQSASTRRWFDDSGSIVRIDRPIGSYAGVLQGDAIIDRFERDELGNLRRAIMAENTIDRRQWEQNLDHKGRVIAVWNSLGVRTERRYGENGCLLRETVAASEEVAERTDYFYDRAGRMTRLVDASGAETQFEYDIWGRMHRVILPSGAVRTLEWSANDLLRDDRVEEGLTDAKLLKRITFDYDKRHRPTFVTVWSLRDSSSVAVPLTSRCLYDRDDRVVEVRGPRGSRLLYEFDKAGRLISTTDPHGNMRQPSYDLFGDLTEIKSVDLNAGGTRTLARQLTYDERGRLRTSTFLDSIIKLSYDDRGLPIEKRPPSGVTTRTEFNAYGQLITSVADPLGLNLRSRYEYDVNGQLSRYIDPMNQSTTWERDPLGRPVKMNPPDGTTWNCFFDSKTRTKRQQTPAGNEVLFEKPTPGGRKVRISAFPAPGQDLVLPRELTFDGLGQLVEASAGAEKVQRQYDTLGRLTEETSLGKTVRIDYDDLAGTVDLIFPDGRRERTSHNAAGQPVSVSLISPGALGGISGEMLFEIVYSPAGLPIQLVYGNGIEGLLVYDDHDRVIRIDYLRSGVLLDSCRLRYDVHGHRALIQYLGAPVTNFLHGFDDVARLVEVRSEFPLATLTDSLSPAAQVVDITTARAAAVSAPGVTYALDAADARTKGTSINGGAGNNTYTLGSDHRVLATSSGPITYNLDGQRTLDARYRYELDACNRVKRIRDRATNEVLAELNYDALSRVSRGSSKGETFERWFAGSRQIHETASTGRERQHSKHPLWPVPFLTMDNDGAAYIHHDEGWSTLSVTDAGGSVLERHRYGAFGTSAILSGSGLGAPAALRTEPMWRGMSGLAGTHLFCTPNRLYDPELGNFTSRDPLLYVDGPSPYSFGAHNPVDFADPTGLAKAPLGNKGYTISPLPPVSGTNYRLNMPHGFLWTQYEGALQDAWNPDNPTWARVVLGLLALVSAPVAGAEEYIGRSALNLPFMIDNLGTRAGEHIGRSLLSLERGESAEALADWYGAIADFALGFLQLAGAAEGLSSSSGRRQVSPAQQPSAGRRSALSRIDSTPGLTKDQIVEQDLDAWARQEGGVQHPSHYGRNNGLDRVYSFPYPKPLVAGEAKFSSGYELGHLEAALNLLKPGLKFGRQGSFEYSYYQALRMTTSKAKTITPAIRQTGSLVLKNLPNHQRVLAVGNEFGGLDVWDLNFWEMYEW